MCFEAKRGGAEVAEEDAEKEERNFMTYFDILRGSFPAFSAPLRFDLSSLFRRTSPALHEFNHLGPRPIDPVADAAQGGLLEIRGERAFGAGIVSRSALLNVWMSP